MPFIEIIKGDIGCGWIWVLLDKVEFYGVLKDKVYLYNYQD